GGAEHPTGHGEEPAARRRRGVRPVVEGEVRGKRRNWRRGKRRMTEPASTPPVPSLLRSDRAMQDDLWRLSPEDAAAVDALLDRRGGRNAWSAASLPPDQAARAERVSQLLALLELDPVEP